MKLVANFLLDNSIRPSWSNDIWSGHSADSLTMFSVSAHDITHLQPWTHHSSAPSTALVAGGIPYKVICTCYEAKDFSFSHLCALNGSPEAVGSEQVCHKKSEIRSSLWCVDRHLWQSWIQAWLENSVSSNTMAKPSQVEYCRPVEPDDDDALIECMSRIGNNRFFWPVFRDEAWYNLIFSALYQSQSWLGGLAATTKYTR